MKAAAALRALVLALLAASLLLPRLWRDGDEGASAILRLASSADAAAWDSALVGAAPRAFVRADTAAPTGAELDRLAAASARAPLVAALPAGAALLSLDAPSSPASGRAAALAVRLRGPAGDSARVVLSDDAGPLDTAVVRLGRDGRGEAAFRVRPPRPGWREWTAAWGGRRAAAGAWVDSAGPPRVLVRAGLPGWEGKFVARALEESGARVRVEWSLGRGLAVAPGDGAAPAGEPTDVTVLLDGAPVSEAERRALAERVARDGGGILAVGDAAVSPALALVRAPAERAAVAGAEVRWSAPAELAPLPPDRVRSDAVAYGPALPGAVSAAASPEGTLLVLRPLGRGRVAALGLAETWRWRMEAGRVDEHRETWRSLVDWLAAAPRHPVAVEAGASVGPVGVPVDVRVYDASGRSPRAITLARPGGRRESLVLSPDADAPGTLRASFVPAAPGLHLLAVDGRPRAGFRATAGAEAADAPWSRLALLASSSGGAAVPADSLDAIVRRIAGKDAEERGGPDWRVVFFAALVLLAGAEWTIRRLGGRA